MLREAAGAREKGLGVSYGLAFGRAIFSPVL